MEDWKFSNGTWKFIGVFDGHGAGIEAVEFVLETLPDMIKASLELAIDTPDIHLDLEPSVIEEILVKCVSDIDDRIKADLVNFFPGGLEQISEMSDDEIKSIIKDPETENSCVQILRARTGTTALIALIEPSGSLHVASLGDSEALLCTRNLLGVWEVKTLSNQHNAYNEVEVDRVRKEHPNEEECIHGSRTLGVITVTRAIGDMPFKLPPIYTERVLALATPPFHENYKIDKLITRNSTPPYLSNRAEVKHVDLATVGPNSKPILILCSDGLVDLYKRRSSISDLPKGVQLWLTTSPIECGSNLASELLWDALGGDGGVQAATKIVRGMPGRRIDDTTVVIVQL